MPKSSEIEQAIGVLETAVMGNGVSEDQHSRIAALAGLAKQARPQMKGTLSDRNAEVEVGILNVLEKRFAQTPDHYRRPDGIDFSEVKRALEADSALLRKLFWMEETGGAPDIIAVNGESYVFADCSAESPSGRRNLNCHQAVQMSGESGVDMLSEADYGTLQKHGRFDRDSWSWLKPEGEAKIGTAREGECYDNGFCVGLLNPDDHNLAGGWRGKLEVPKV